MYRLASYPLTWEGALWSAILQGGSGTVAYRRSAAAWWGLDGLGRTDHLVPEVAMGWNGRRGQTGVTRLRTLAPGTVTPHRSMPVTTAGRTLLDLGTLGDLDLLERAAESGLRTRQVDLASLLEMVVDGRRRGAMTLRQMLGRRDPLVPPTESDAETLFVQLLRRSLLPPARRQVELVLRGRRVRLDFAWTQSRIAVEVDGAATHCGPEALGRDLRRQNRIVTDGWLILRFTWEDIARYPDDVLADLSAAWLAQLGRQGRTY